MTSAPVQHVDHLIVGAGFAGLCAAIKLQEDGETDFLVVEKGSDVGGTWRDNTYPGAACDVPSQLYSFSFAPNPEWTQLLLPQPEIQDYIRGVAKRSGTLDRFVFDTSFDDASWDEAAGRWTAQITGPTGTRTVVARTLIVGAGGLSEPKLPDIEGIETFQGELFHSARWDHSVDLTGKRVAVIGTGASAIQIVPELQQVAGHLDVYQRTAPWVIPRNDRVYKPLERQALRRFPWLRQALPHRHLLGPRGLRARVHDRAEDRRAGARRPRRRTSPRASPTPSCARRSRRTSSSAASGCCAPTPTTPPSPPTTPSS